MRSLILSYFFFLCALASHAQSPQLEAFGPHSVCVIRAVSSHGQFIGFDVFADGQLAAPVRFSSQGLIYSNAVQTLHKDGSDTLVFNDLAAIPECGLELQHSKIEVKLEPQRYPEVSFTLHIKSFDPGKWQAFIGNQPFHFLNIGMADAEVWHQHGQLFPTPRSDPFPLLYDIQVNSPRIASAYNRQWSCTPALHSQLMPVIGLWSPHRMLYAAWDFQATRSWDGTEGALATGFCNRLLTPQTAAEHRRMLGYDANGKLLELPDDSPIVSSKPLPTDTPAQLKYGADLYEKEQNRAGYDKFVALVYPASDPGALQPAFPKSGESLISHARLIFSPTLNSTFDPNRMLWESWRNDPVIQSHLPQIPMLSNIERIQVISSLKTDQLVDYKVFNSKTLAEKEKVINEYIKEAKHFRSEREICVYWILPHPAMNTKGETSAPHPTLHNSQGWEYARLILDFYRLTRKPQYLAIIDGVFNWTKKTVWSESERPTLKDRTDTSDGPKAVSFLMDYYFTFKSDSDRRTSALLALDLACSFTYRTLSFWTSADSNVNGISTQSLKMLIEAAVHTGDPTLLWALQRSVRAKSTHNASLNSGNTISNTDLSEDSVMDIVAGERAALALHQRSWQNKIAKYRSSGDGDFAFTVRSLQIENEISITFPYVDISAKPVLIIRKGVSRIPLTEGREVHRSTQSPWTVTVSGVQNGDIVVVGNPDLASAEVLPSE